MLSLPLWMAKQLHSEGLVELITPDSFKTRMQNQLRRGPLGAALRDKSQSYFQVGTRIAFMSGNKELAASIFHASTERNRLLIEKSALKKRLEKNEAEFLHLLTNSEQERKAKRCLYFSIVLSQ